MGSFLKYVIGPVVAAIIGRAVLAALHEIGYYPDLWLAGLIVKSPELFQQEIAWVLSGALAIVLTISWHYFNVGRFVRDLGGSEFDLKRIGKLKGSVSAASLEIQHEKLRDTEPWPEGNGHNVKFRVANISNSLAKNVSARIRSLEFLEISEWKQYGHDYAEVPLRSRDGKDKFDLPAGDENSMYIARRPNRPAENIQLCYAVDGIPNTIPSKPAWRVGVRVVSDNCTPKDAVFQLRVSADESLIGTLLDDESEDELARRKTRAEYIGQIYAEAVELRNQAASLRVLDARSESKMDELQHLLLDEMRNLAPERAINLQTLNLYNPSDHIPMALQDPKRTLEFSEFLKRVMEVLEDYK